MDYIIDARSNLMLNKYQFEVAYRMEKEEPNKMLHSHQGLEIYFFQGGSASYIYNDQIYQLVPGDMLFFNSERIHRAIPSQNEKYIRSFIHFMPSFIMNHLSKDEYNQVLSLFNSTSRAQLIRWKSEERESIEKLFELLEYEKKGNMVCSQTMIRNIFLQLLITCYRKYNGMSLQAVESLTNQKERYVHRILKIINSNYQQDLNLVDLAEQLHISKYYMCHCFKEVTGMTINRYLNNIRIDEGKKLLLTTQESIGIISESLGFNNIVHFSRLFKQYVGKSPQLYRKKYSLDNEE